MSKGETDRRCGICGRRIAPGEAAWRLSGRNEEMVHASCGRAALGLAERQPPAGLGIVIFVAALLTMLALLWAAAQ